MRPEPCHCSAREASDAGEQRQLAGCDWVPKCSQQEQQEGNDDGMRQGSMSVAGTMRLASCGRLCRNGAASVIEQRI